MSKALDILKKLNEVGALSVSEKKSSEAILEVENMVSRIAELEAQEAKSCYGCKNKGTHIFNMDCLICSRHYSDGYISKDI